MANWSVHEAFERQAHLCPEAEAVRADGQALSYGALDQWSNQIARKLRKEGVKPGHVVALGAADAMTQVAALLAILKAEACFVCIDSKWPELRRKTVFDEMKPIFAMGAGAPDGWPVMNIDRECLVQYTASPLEKVTGSPRLAYAVYTSGSTGRPKGIWMSHRSLNRFLVWAGKAWQIREGLRVGQWVELTFDPAYVDILATLTHGGTLCLADRNQRRDAGAIAEWIKREEVKILQTTPSFCREIMANGKDELRAMESMVLAGEVLPKDLAESWLQEYGSSPRLCNLYGPSEVVAATWHVVERMPMLTRTVPVGRAVAGRNVVLLDSNGNICSSGVAGEIWITGRYLMEGYVGGDHATPGLGLEEDRWSGATGTKAYRTGDVGCWTADGLLEFHGRLDHQVKIRGIRVELNEIESVLRENPRVRDAVVVVNNEAPDQQRLVAYVLKAKDAPTAPRREAEFWPCVDGYGVQADWLFDGTVKDKGLLASYEAAIRQVVGGKVVFDVGTGPHAQLARKCIQAGAKVVYAIESNPEAFEQARRSVSAFGLSQQVVLIEGDLASAELPEQVDVCISGIVGTIGSTRGALSVLPGAWRHLRRGGTMIPRRSVTWIAAVQLPESLRTSICFGSAARSRADQVFRSIGYPFDLKVAIENFPQDHVLSTSAIFEELDFSKLTAASESQFELAIREDGRLDGFLLWLSLWTCDDEVFDSLAHTSNLTPVFVPVFYPGQPVNAGDRVMAACTRRPSTENERHLDYQIEGVIVDREGRQRYFRYRLPHYQRLYRASKFYEQLFGDNDKLRGESREEEDLVNELHQWGRQKLPEYMVPSHTVILESFPLTSHGKVDRQDLAARAAPGTTAGRQPATAREKILCSIVAQLLGVSAVSVDDNLAWLGVNSLLSIQLVSRARQAGLAFTFRDVFSHPTIGDLAEAACEVQQPSISVSRLAVNAPGVA